MPLAAASWLGPGPGSTAACSAVNQEELGALVRVGKNAVGAWEAGRSRPDVGSVPVICEALGEHVLSQYVEGKEKEWDAYRTHVSRWEIDRYIVMY